MEGWDYAAARIRAVAQRVMAAGPSSPRLARDPVNLPMIRNWVEAIGDANPVYTDPEIAAASVHGCLVAPPAMVQAWTMPGLHGVRDASDPLSQMSAALDQAGYTSVVATNSDQVYHRYLRHGEQLTVRISLIDLIGPKTTALGEGWFFTTRSNWYAGDEPVATMDFRILKFRPPAAAAGTGTPAGYVMRPVSSPDTAFFWAGTAAGELRIQRCGDCGALRHPPGPLCPQCGSPRPDYTVAAGTGEVFSYVVHHHPPVPGKQLPIVIALVQLDEGVRMVGELVGVDPEQVRIGLPVKVEYLRIDDELTLPAWRLAEPDERPAADTHDKPAAHDEPAAAHGEPAAAHDEPAATHDEPAGGQLARERSPGETAELMPELAVQASTTFVIASALATRDFQDVHHDRDRAVARGSKDIFLNILTTTGLVQRFASGWAGPQSILRQISIRLGAPCYAGDTLTFSGQITEHRTEAAAAPADGGSADPSAELMTDCYQLAVVGRCSLGDHVTGTVRIDIRRSRP